MSTLSLSDINIIVNIAQTIVLAIIGVFSWLGWRSHKNKASIEQLEQRDHSFNERLSLIEAQLKSWADVNKNIGQITQQLAKIDGQLSGIKHQQNKDHDLIKELFRVRDGRG